MVMTPADTYRARALCLALFKAFCIQQPSKGKLLLSSVKQRNEEEGGTRMPPRLHRDHMVDLGLPPTRQPRSHALSHLHGKAGPGAHRRTARLCSSALPGPASVRLAPLAGRPCLDRAPGCSRITPFQTDQLQGKRAPLPQLS